MDDIVSGLRLEQDSGQIYAPTIAGLFAELFERESVEHDDDFFQLGGDSLLAESLAASVEQSLGVAMPISILMEASTPRTLAATLFDMSRRRGLTALIAVRPEGDGPALFCVHGTAGDSLLPRRLAAALARNCPIYAFRASGIKAGERPMTSIRAMADAYLAAMRTVQPHGPYLIAGTCGGSVIVQEMAQRLVAAGDAVQGIVLVDPVVAEMAPFLHASGLRLEIIRSGWKKRAADIDAWFDAHPEATFAERQRLVRRAMAVACGQYMPRRYDGATLLIVSPARKPALLDRTRGYPSLLSNLAVVEIDTEHDLLFNERADDIAGAMDAFLERVAPLA